MFMKFINRKERLIVPFIIVVAILFLGIVVNLPKAFQASSEKKLKPIYKVNTEEKKIAISFDACWGAEKTSKILDVCDKYNIKTTFFLVNIWLKDYPDKAKEIVKRGHELGLHSTTHPQFTKLSDRQIKEELQQNKDMIKEITGFDADLFRPPFGDYDTRVIKKIQGMNIYPIQWSIDSLDWKDVSASQMADNVIKKAGPGDIVLFHNDGKHTVEAIDEIINTLQSQGFKIVPVSEIIYKGDYYVDNNGIQHKK